MMPAGHHSDSDSTLLPLPKSALTWFGGIFARLRYYLAAGLFAKLNCRRRFSSVLPDTLISSNVSRTSNEINQGITSKAKHEQLVNNGEFPEIPLSLGQ